MTLRKPNALLSLKALKSFRVLRFDSESPAKFVRLYLSGCFSGKSVHSGLLRAILSLEKLLADSSVDCFNFL